MSSGKNHNWKTISIKEVYNNPWIKVDEHQVINPSGGEEICDKVHFKNKAIGIIPLIKVTIPGSLGHINIHRMDGIGRYRRAKVNRILIRWHRQSKSLRD